MLQCFLFPVLFSFCCYRRCTRRQHTQNSGTGEEQQQEERRPLLERLRLRQRLAERHESAHVEMREIVRRDHRASPGRSLGGHSEPPIYRGTGGARPRTTGPAVSLDCQRGVARVSGLELDSRRGLEVIFFW